MKKIILLVIKMSAVCNDWYLIDLLVDAYFNDIEYFETLIKNLLCLIKLLLDKHLSKNNKITTK